MTFFSGLIPLTFYVDFFQLTFQSTPIPRNHTILGRLWWWHFLFPYLPLFFLLGVILTIQLSQLVPLTCRSCTDCHMSSCRVATCLSSSLPAWRWRVRAWRSYWSGTSCTGKGEHERSPCSAISSRTQGDGAGEGGGGSKKGGWAGRGWGLWMVEKKKYGMVRAESYEGSDD